MQVCHYSKCTSGLGPGQAHRVVTPEAIAAVEAIMKENRRVTVNLYGTQWKLHRKKKRSHCVPFVFSKLRDKTYLRCSLDSPSYDNFKTLFK